MRGGGPLIKKKEQTSMGTTFPKSEYVSIRIKSLHPSKPIPFDIYIAINERPVHYLRAGDSLESEKIQKFQTLAPESFCIRNEDQKKYRDYIQDRLNNDPLEITEKATILRESSLAIVQELFQSPDVGTALTNAKDVIENFLEFMDDQPTAMSELLGLSKHDFYTFNHSVDVSIYSLGLGSLLGYRGKDLKDLGEGALLHDIGKRNVSIDIITKTGPLTPEEWDQMKKHPDYGLFILRDIAHVNANIKACVFEHHESFLGNGYPMKLTGDQIHPMARVVAVTDTYDALTTKRSYNDPMLPKDAIQFMQDKLHARFDKEVLTAMASVLLTHKKTIAS